LLFTVAILNFLLLQAAPGDVVDAIVADTGGASEEVSRGFERNTVWINPLACRLVQCRGFTEAGLTRL
jgi:hypothetical protein